MCGGMSLQVVTACSTGSTAGRAGRALLLLFGPPVDEGVVLTVLWCLVPHTGLTEGSAAGSPDQLEEELRSKLKAEKLK